MAGTYSDTARKGTSPQYMQGLLEKTKAITKNISHTSFFSPQNLLVSTTSYDTGYPFVPLRSAVVAMSLPNFLFFSILYAGSVVQETEKTFSLRKHCSSTTKMLVTFNSVLVTNSKQSTTWVTVKKINSRPKPVLMPMLIKAHKYQNSLIWKRASNNSDIFVSPEPFVHLNFTMDFICFKVVFILFYLY